MYNYQKICQELLKDLPQRQKEVILRRFGLQGPGEREKETLEAVGRDFGITRERVRQIEEDGFLKIKPKIVKYQKVFQYFSQYLKRYGGLRKEEILLTDLGGKKQRAQIYFLLTISGNFERFGEGEENKFSSSPFTKVREDEDFYSFWELNYRAPRSGARRGSLNFVRRAEGETGEETCFCDHLLPFASLGQMRRSLSDSDSLSAAKNIINTLSGKLREIGRPLSLKELSSFSEIKNLALTSTTEPPKEARWEKRFISSVLEISKKILQNSDGLYGLKDWPEINPRGVKDKAYLVFKKLGKPLHFNEVAELIEGALTQTVHNELIKDSRFVLVGRGIYALKEWGYESGQVKDVISKILKENGPLTQSEILERVLKQRLVKENTILLNLSNKKHFLRDSQGKYKILEI